jgi:hypothetical protein
MKLYVVIFHQPEYSYTEPFMRGIFRTREAAEGFIDSQVEMGGNYSGYSQADKRDFTIFEGDVL